MIDRHILFIKWLEWAYQVKGMTQKAIADRSGLSEHHISQIKIGMRKNIRVSTIEKFVQAIGISYEEFFNEPAPVEKELERKRKKQKVAFDEFSFIRHYNVVASAGGGTVVDEETVDKHLAFRTEWIRTFLNANPDDLFLLDVTGDSMYPTLNNGDLVLVDKSKVKPMNDGIFIFRLDGDLLIKRIERLITGGYLVKSDNPRYGQYEISPGENAQIFGRVVWFARSIT
jgi:phage repressor protein C with HTH and peptisase S24 domain